MKLKMANSNFFFLFIFFTFSLSVCGQNIDFSDVHIATSRDSDSKKDAEGSPYIFEEFSLVKLSISDSKMYRARFNAHNGEMEIKTDDQLVILDNSKDLEVHFMKEEKLYKTCNYKREDSKEVRGFLVVLSDNDSLDLFKEERISFTEEKPAKSSYSEATPARFVTESDVFYYKHNNSIAYLPTKKKDFLNLFPNYESEIKTYMKKNKLNPKNEDELIIIFNFIDNLIKENS